MTSNERELGNLEARMQNVESELHGIRQDVREIRDALVGVKGGWRTLERYEFRRLHPALMK